MIPYTINGEEHYLPDEELQAVEMSGRSRWQDYALTPGEWPAPTVPVCPLMDARPGAVEPGLRPVQKRKRAPEMSRVVRLTRSRYVVINPAPTAETEQKVEQALARIKREARQRNALRYQARASSKYHWQGNRMCVHARGADAIDGAEFDATDVPDRCQSCQYSFVNA